MTAGSPWLRCGSLGTVAENCRPWASPRGSSGLSTSTLLGSYGASGAGSTAPGMIAESNCTWPWTWSSTTRNGAMRTESTPETPVSTTFSGLAEEADEPTTSPAASYT